MLGSNVPTVGGLIRAFDYADEWNCRCIQIYATPSRQWKCAPLSRDLPRAFRARWESSVVDEVVIHIPFLVNLASPDRSIRTKARERLQLEVERARQLGVKFLVLHPGSHGASTRAQGVEWTVQGIEPILGQLEQGACELLLENMAGQGTALGSRFAEIADLLDGLGSKGGVGVCFDTAHAFIAGYRLHGYEGYETVLREFDKVVGVDRIRAIHLNDSKVEMASRNDRHAAVGEGTMGLQVFHSFVREKKFQDVPKILEIPDRDGKSAAALRLLRKLARVRRPVAEPPTFLRPTEQQGLPGLAIEAR